MHSYIRIVALHLGTLAVQRGSVKGAVSEPDHKTVFGGYLQETEGPAEATEDPTQWSEGPKARNNISTDLVLSPGKPRCTSNYFKL